MTYQEAIKYLESFVNYENFSRYPYKKSIKLKRITGFLRLIGNPQEDLKCIHVAGTKGKGSVCAFLTYILREAGYKCALYTSPHLEDFRERVRILSPRATISRRREEFEGMISKKDLTELIRALKPKIEKYNRNSRYGALTFFEVYTALAFSYFRDQQIDYLILETGLGGRLDATNAVQPLVCVITPISYEHTQKLGKTLAKIAAEKAGIVKNAHAIVISAPQNCEAAEVIRGRCAKTGATLLEIGREIKYTRGKGGELRIRGVNGEYGSLKPSLLGEHQLVNAATAVAAIEALNNYGAKVSAEAIRRGLQDTLWPGRLEVLKARPLIVLDGAQNTASAQALNKAVRKHFKYNKLILILGISSDKDIKGVCESLDNLGQEVILTRANNPRAANPEDLSKYFAGKRVYLTASVEQAKKIALSIAGKNDLILVAGSLFVVGEFRNAKV